MTALPTPSPATADIGLIGLAVMGQNLALNMADHGNAVAVYNRTTSKTEQFVADNPQDVFGSTGGSLVPAAELADFVASIKRPRRIIILVQAGRGTDAVIQSLLPHLDKDDIIIDGGNALYTDTERREKELSAQGFRFIGSGVSGGELGARFGPSLMPGGDKAAWEELKPIWEAISAKVDAETGAELTGASAGNPIQGGEACTAYVGSGGAGHYVKMVHNGIEYGDMQLICEAYHILSTLGGLSAQQCADVFAKWNAGSLNSFLIEITADILSQADPVTGKPFVEIVLDTAGQKGTGRWTGIEALQMGIPATIITESVFSRCVSALKEERVIASKTLNGPNDASFDAARGMFEDTDALIAAVGSTLYAAKICSYAQGFQLMRAASHEHDWDLDFGSIASIWRGGCIIRARFLQHITDAYSENPDLQNLILAPYFTSVIQESQSAWRSLVAASALAGVPAPCMAAGLAWYDGYRHETLPANLLQAQRDYFGAHTYERTDSPRGEMFHIDWPEDARPQLNA